MIDLSVIIVTWNRRNMTRDCLASVYQEAGDIAVEVIVVDNASEDGTAAMVREEFPHAALRESPVNLGFSKGNNVGMRAARGRYVLLLNSDTIVLDRALETMVRFADAHPQVGALGCLLLDTERKPTVSYGAFPSFTTVLCEMLFLDRFPLTRPWCRTIGVRPADNEAAHRVDYVSGACIMVRREVIERVGMLDEQFMIYFEETDWCWRMQRDTDWQVWYLPTARVLHLEKAKDHTWYQRGQRIYISSMFKFFRKHYGRVGVGALACLMQVWMTAQVFVHLVQLMLSPLRCAAYRDTLQRKLRLLAFYPRLLCEVW